MKNSNYIYRKLFRNYTIIITLIVFVLEFYFITSIREQRQETNLSYTQIMCENAVNYVKKMTEDMTQNHRGIFQKETVEEDMVWYLESPIEEYLQKKLDAYSESNKDVYEGVRDFVTKALDQNKYINQISLISYIQNRKTDYNRADNKSYDFSKLDLERLNAHDMVGENGFTLKKELNNPLSLEAIGMIRITYSKAGLEEALQDYIEAELIAFDGEGTVLYSSEDMGSEQFFDANNILLGNVQIEKQLNAFAEVRKIEGLTIVAYMDKLKAREIPFGVWVTLISVGIGLFIIGELFAHLKLKNMEKRLDKILQAMNQVTEGNLEVRIECGIEDDELDVIGENFNHMCIDLKNHIQKSYMAQIEQKNAEISALQSQINPHFLYNTLESIRMKAISNGDREVGKMLYGLAVIFRSQVKESNIITLAKELHYCKKYLELFEFRYQDKFNFEIQCEEEWMNVSVIKFVIQPFIENYFVHGIRLEDSDNLLRISVKGNSNDVCILIEDNGRGMTEEEVREKNSQLSQNSQEGNSIGMINVQRRMRAVYGNNYGVQVEKREQGILVMLRFPKEVMECIK